jgi:hypothetical protein
MDRNELNAANARSRRDLAAFTATLDAAALATDVGGGWTVAMALAHTAFWDLHTAEQWRRRGDLVTPATETYDTADIVNGALDPLLAAIPGAEVVRLALAAAAEVDAVVEALPDASIDAIRAEERGWLVDAWEHRHEHVAQANRGLGRS